jgi:hypothetical protein
MSSFRARRSLFIAAVVAAPLLVGAAKPSSSSSAMVVRKSEMGLRGRTEQGIAAAGTITKAGANGINFNGGAVMTAATTNVYVIWYGTWTNTTKTSTIADFLGTIGTSPYYNINTTYTDKAGVKVKNSVTLAGTTTDAASQGTTNLSDAQIQTIVSTAITGGKLAKDTNGLYFVLTSADVTKSGFLTQYCGWHASATIGGTNIKYSFVGDPTGASLANCAGQTTASPNGDPGADAMVSVIAHELEETVTDPNLNAWYDSRGRENGDKCAWTFGTTYAATGGGVANMKLGARDFLVQQNWLNASGGKCVLAYP